MSNYRLEEVVWAKMKGYPWWPAVVSTIDQIDKFGKGKEGKQEVIVRFLVDFQ